MTTKSIWKHCQSEQQPLNREILKILAKGGDYCLVGSSILRVDSITLIETMQSKQNKWQSEKIPLIIPDIQVNKQHKTKIFCSKIFDFITKSSSVQE